MVVAAVLGFPACAQEPQPMPGPSPQLSPKAAYEEAMRPLEVTRHSLANWSEVEIAAMKVSIARAAKECGARDAKAFTGDELVDYAQLCGLGQAWPAVVDAASRYIAEDAPAKPRLDQAYADLIHAELYLKDEPSAFTHAKAMLAAVPYDPLTAEAVGEAMEYMQFVHTNDALKLGALREPLVLARMAEAAVPPQADAKPGTTVEPPQPLHELYAAGLAFAGLQQLAKSPVAEVTATVAALDAALPAALPPDDALPIATSRRRYALLGKPLPKIATTAYLSMPNKLPALPAVNAVTALLLFPDWCAQCVRMGSQFPETVFMVTNQEAYLYGLLTETVPPSKPHPEGTAPQTGFDPADASLVLRETPTFAVKPETLEQFGATDVPFLIVTDTQGTVRVLQPVGEDSLAPGSTVDSAIARVVAQWPNVRVVHPRAGTSGGPDRATPGSSNVPRP
jgi:hypothetical protein